MDYMDIIADPMEPVNSESSRFVVDDDSKAAWCVRKIREAEEERDKMIAWYEAMMDKATSICAANVEYFKRLLRDYAETVPMKETKTQFSYPIPGAKLVFKKAHDVMEHDDPVVIAALKAQGRTEFIKTKESLDWAALKAEINETGELPDGITLRRVEDEFTVQMTKED